MSHKLTAVLICIFLISGVLFSQKQDVKKSTLFEISQISYMTMTSIDLGFSLCVLENDDTIAEANPLVRAFMDHTLLAITVNLASNLLVYFILSKIYSIDKTVGIVLSIIANVVVGYVLISDINLIRRQ